jgi:multiple sugar transport system permease protein
MATATAQVRGDLAKVRAAQVGPVRRWAPLVGVALIVVYCLAPFYWMAVSALRRPSDQFSNRFIPSPFSIQNFRDVFKGSNGFGRGLLNSLIVAGTVTILTLLIGMVAAYTLARLDFKFKNLVLAIIITTSMFPGISLVVPLLKLFIDIKWINTYQAMIVPSLSFALPLAVWNLTAFFRQMPRELEQAAPGVFTTAIITFIAAWNEFLIALSMTNKKSIQTANVIISQFTGTTGRDQPFGSQMAAGVVVTIPLVIAVLLFQRRIVAGLTAGGVK